MALEIPNAAAAICGFEIQPAYVGANAFTSASAVLSGINDELQGDGLIISDKSIGLSEIFSAFTGHISGTVQILNQSGQELDDTDLASQWADACAQENMSVISFGVQQIVGASTGVNTGTGGQSNNVLTTGAGNAPGGVANQPSGVPACGDPNLSFWKYPEQWITCLTQKGLATVGLLAIGLVIGIILLVLAQEKIGKPSHA